METERQSGRSRLRWVWWAAGGLLLATALVVGVVAVALSRAEPYLRTRIVEGLTNRFHARVELDDFHVSLVNGLWAEGKGLRIWPPADVEGVAVPPGQGEPLIRLEEFRFHAPLTYRPGKPVHLSLVELRGLLVHLPPRSHFEHVKPAVSSVEPPRPGSTAGLVRFELDTLECDGAELVLETSKPGKLPMNFPIRHLKLTHLATDGAMGFEAELTNPRPEGTIKTKGSFGPWHTADPGESPLKGEYRLENANLGSFKEIGGTLNSIGQFEGTLRDLVVDGTAETLDFRLTAFGTALPLRTKFHAKVDGTNGDTWLEPVEATLGQSHFWAQGPIVRVPGPVVDGRRQSVGHDIALTINVDQARIEDFLRLASKTGAAMMTGDVTAKAKLHIPPGTAHVHERMTLNGRFGLGGVRFASEKIQGRIAELSLRGQGQPGAVKTADKANILSAMEGTFNMGAGVLTLPSLKYSVPGAVIDLHGTYGMEGGALEFDGTARLEATVSKIVGGWKGFLLKPADRFLRKEGAGTQVPIHIGGTREAPSFGVDFERFKFDLQPPPKQQDAAPPAL